MEHIRNFITMFSQSIGVKDPWYINRVEFLQADRAVHIFVRARETARYLCPICGAESERYDNEDKERTWRHCDVVFYPCYVHCRRPRVKCSKHGIHVVTPPWARVRSRFTLLMAEMPIAKVQEALRISQSALTRILQYWVMDPENHTDLSDVHTLCIDETAHKKRQRYGTLVIDAQKHRVIVVEEGRDASAIEAFATKLEEKGGSCDNIMSVASDMSSAYLKGSEDWFPKAESRIDRFHVKKLLLDAMEMVRREELGLPKYKKGFLQRKLLMIPQGKCTPAQAQKVSFISKACPKTGRAYRMVQALDLCVWLRYGSRGKNPSERTCFMDAPQQIGAYETRNSDPSQASTRNPWVLFRQTYQRTCRRYQQPCSGSQAQSSRLSNLHWLCLQHLSHRRQDLSCLRVSLPFLISSWNSEKCLSEQSLYNKVIFLYNTEECEVINMEGQKHLVLHIGDETFLLKVSQLTRAQVKDIESLVEAAHDDHGDELADMSVYQICQWFQDKVKSMY